MNTEREKMLVGELYNALDPELVQERDRARDLCKTLTHVESVAECHGGLCSI